MTWETLAFHSSKLLLLPLPIPGKPSPLKKSSFRTELESLFFFKLPLTQALVFASMVAIHACTMAQNVLYFLNEFLISVSHHLNSKLHVGKRLNFS